MRLTREHLKKLILNELENSINEDNDLNFVSLDESTMDLNADFMSENFDMIADQNLTSESEENLHELKTINEEIKRMKQLVDFRSPLLHDDDL